MRDQMRAHLLFCPRRSRTLIGAWCLVLGVSIAGTAMAGPMALSQGTKTVTTAGTPVALVSSENYVSSVEIYPSKNSTTANTGTILIGFASGAGNQKRPLLTGGPGFVISAEAGKTINLATIFLDAATSGDGVVWSAVKR